MPSIYPEFEGILPAENFSGTSLSANLAELDDIAASLNFVALGSLINARTMALEVLDGSELSAKCPPMQWYLPQEGLATVQGLLACSERLPNKGMVTEALQSLEVLLAEAKARDVRFHLLVDI